MLFRSVNLYVIVNIIKSNITNEMVRYVLPMVIVSILALLVITLFPQLTLWLPAASGLYTPRF